MCIESLPVAGKSLTLIPSIREYCRQAALDNTVPQKHEEYQNVGKSVTLHKLLKAEHHFWISFTQDSQPFLVTYKPNMPMIPFLASDLQKLLRSVITRFLKENVTTSAKTLTQLAKIGATSDDDKN